MAILAGLLSVAFGIWGIFHWPGDFGIILRGMLPVSLVFAGVVALIVGLSKLFSPSDLKGHDKT